MDLRNNNICSLPQYYDCSTINTFPNMDTQTTPWILQLQILSFLYSTGIRTAVLPASDHMKNPYIVRATEVLYTPAVPRKHSEQLACEDEFRPKILDFCRHKQPGHSYTQLPVPTTTASYVAVDFFIFYFFRVRTHLSCVVGVFVTRERLYLRPVSGMKNRARTPGVLIVDG